MKRTLHVRYLDFRPVESTEGAYMGCDFTGEVVKVGPNLKVDLKEGDKVSATVIGGECLGYVFASPPT